jgi:hypothetical protein
MALGGKVMASVRCISIRLKLFDLLGCEILTCDAESILRA